MGRGMNILMSRSEIVGRLSKSLFHLRDFSGEYSVSSPHVRITHEGLTLLEVLGVDDWEPFGMPNSARNIAVGIVHEEAKRINESKHSKLEPRGNIEQWVLLRAADQARRLLQEANCVGGVVKDLYQVLDNFVLAYMSSSVELKQDPIALWAFRAVGAFYRALNQPKPYREVLTQGRVAHDALEQLLEHSKTWGNRSEGHWAG